MKSPLVKFCRIFALLKGTDRKPLGMAIFLSVALVITGFFAPSFKLDYGSDGRGILGGATNRADAAIHDPILQAAAIGTGPMVLGYSPENSHLAAVEEFTSGDQSIAGAVSDHGVPIGPVFSRENLLIYRVQKGDTLSGIAAYFGISLDTIVNANPTIRARFLQLGDELNILPTSGVVYRTRGGDTLESIADYFNIQPGKLVQFNKPVNFATLGVGIPIVIPGGKAGLAARANSLPDFSGNFIKPADGFNWKIIHHYNAIDIANSCGVPVVASAEGLIVPDESFGDGRSGWNGGYGQFVLIEHPFGNGVRTRYAHLKKVLVEIGDYVKQGQEIGIMGDSGDATGCHVHFEVYGAENPFSR
ncbi:MAG: peptidoglycan DD-metalloendopeptidase family protein [Candidatus Liptonbacteria bacterium]|nr:peptidoglycan DD-metalloendopeptidase family protein [Candidatus Liptonbacteria bacterium]